MLNLTKRKNRSRKSNYKIEKALCKLIGNVVCGKTNENMRSIINVKLVSNKKDYLDGHQCQTICHKKHLIMI